MMLTETQITEKISRIHNKLASSLIACVLLWHVS